jgi:hypothetical protein
MIANVVTIIIVAVIRIWLVKRIIPRFSIREYAIKFGFAVMIIVLLSSIIPVYMYYSFSESFLRFCLVISSFIMSLSLTSYYIALNNEMRKKVVAQIGRKLKMKINY